MIYLDYQATTPLAPEAAAAMRPWLETNFGNPHSPHRIGREAAAAIEVAREHVFHALNFQPARVERSRDTLSSEAENKRLGSAQQGPSTSLGANGERRLFFTSGATEAANWALKGAATRLPENKRKIVTLATEHACVLDTVEWLGGLDFDIDIIPVQPDGLVDLNRVADHVDDRTGLVAAMLVNNEIGVIQPVAEISAIARRHGALVFCDAVQGFGRVPVPLDACDMVAVSAHKVHGPKGIGALWIRDGVAIDPLLHGGGQEGGIRSGTLSPALCVGFGEAARLLSGRQEEDRVHVERLRATALSQLDGWSLNGSADRRYQGNLNLRCEGIDAARLISEVRGVAFSAGSACASGSGRPSHVLAALGLSEREARSSIRLGFGRYTTEGELAQALALIREAAQRQRIFAA
ncbi:cysteine desulfurase family protein [Enterovirga sp. GCM10030262]|uniref:cysteine desulfurase family protein n=1 Tax=Enterovirga sp. GCM10030262 TaxID=3273391 RepID=UPI00361489B9